MVGGGEGMMMIIDSVPRSRWKRDYTVSEIASVIDLRWRKLRELAGVDWSGMKCENRTRQAKTLFIPSLDSRDLLLTVSLSTVSRLLFCIMVARHFSQRVLKAKNRNWTLVSGIVTSYLLSRSRSQSALMIPQCKTLEMQMETESSRP